MLKPNFYQELKPAISFDEDGSIVRRSILGCESDFTTQKLKKAAEKRKLANALRSKTHSLVYLKEKNKKRHKEAYVNFNMNTNTQSKNDSSS